MSTIILGVDPGLRETGLAVVEKEKSSFKILYTAEIKTKSKEELPKRLQQIFSFLEEVSKEFNPSLLVLEKLYSHYKHPLTSSLLGHARGVIMLYAERYKMKVVEYPATRVKKAVTSYGTASKSQMKKMMSYICGLDQEIKSQHIADALALVVTYLNTQRS